MPAVVPKGSCPADRRFAYVPFPDLSTTDQDRARRMYTHKEPWLPDEAYLYPVKRDGSLAYANRYCPQNMAQPYIDAHYAAKLATLSHKGKV